MESALIVRGYSEDIGSVSLDVAGIGSYTVNGQYYFNTNKFRPFVGAGSGIYSLSAITYTDKGVPYTAIGSESKFGFYPRAGFDLGHFNLTIDYNFLSSSTLTNSNGQGQFTNSYLAIKKGVSFGGGRSK